MLRLAEKQNRALGESWIEPAPVTEPTPEPQPRREPQTVVAALTDCLIDLGVEQAFGVSGGAIALLFDAFVDSDIELRHFRHETGAAFAATEAYFASGRPSVVFTTTGPGLLNSLTGMTAARWEGAKVVMISGATSAPQRGRWATQETSSYTLPQDGLFTAGPIFDFAVKVESPAELPEVFRRLALGLARPGGFVAHVSIPMGVQSKRVELPKIRPRVSMAAPAAAQADVERCARLLKQGSFAIWAGFGATRAASSVRELVERSGAKIFCSPRAKGIVPEDHPSYLGVSGLGGHATVTEYMLTQRPSRVLVLGTRLGEPTSFWDRDMVPEKGFIHVDLDPGVPGTAYPDALTFGIQAEIGHFLTALLEHFPARPGVDEPAGEQESDVAGPPELGPRELGPREVGPRTTFPANRPERPARIREAARRPVRPRVLMDSIQHWLIDNGDTVLLAECGNSFAWCNHYLRFSEPARYRVSTLFGSMGHAAAGVVGAALARHGKAVAVVGDGSMLMNSELSSAAQYQAQAVWVILNDAGYGMCRDGHRALGLTDSGIDIPRVDFVGMARSVGADGVTVEAEDEIDQALRQAMAAEGPFVVDVRIDSNEPSPLLERFESLIKQGNSKTTAGWER